MTATVTPEVPDIQTDEEFEAALWDKPMAADRVAMITARDAAIRRDECERDIRAENFVVPDEASRDAVQIVRLRFIAAVRAREPGAVG